jgi:hypothetical protein
MEHGRAELEKLRALVRDDRAREFWAVRFGQLRDQYRRDDGSQWTYAALERATGGVARARFLSDLGRGEILDPGFIKIRALSIVMGFPVDRWFEDL